MARNKKILKILRFIERNAEKIFGVILLASMVGLLFAVVIARFVFNRGLGVAIELDRMAFVWLVYIAAGFAAWRGAHLRLQVAFSLWPEKIREYIKVLADMIWLVFNIIIVKEGIGIVKSMFIYPYESPALGWSMAYAYMIIPISFTLMSIRIVQRTITKFRHLKK